MHLRETTIHPQTGTFTGHGLKIESAYMPAATGSTSSGRWHGQFSNRPDATGNPGMVGGALSGEWDNSVGGLQTVIGTFVATTPPAGEH